VRVSGGRKEEGRKDGGRGRRRGRRSLHEGITQGLQQHQFRILLSCDLQGIISGPDLRVKDYSCGVQSISLRKELGCGERSADSAIDRKQMGGRVRAMWCPETRPVAVRLVMTCGSDGAGSCGNARGKFSSFKNGIKLNHVLEYIASIHKWEHDVQAGSGNAWSKPAGLGKAGEPSGL
jgi:hypothetical protein